MTETPPLPRKPRPTPTWLYGVIILSLILGIILGVALNVYANTLQAEWDKVEASGQITTGVVTRRSPVFDDNKDVTYEIRVDGQVHREFEMVSDSDWAALPEGAEVRVMYLQEDGEVLAHLAGNAYAHQMMRYYAYGSWVCTLLPGAALALVFIMTWLQKKPKASD